MSEPTMVSVIRDRETETRIRKMDTYEIVELVHDLEDEIRCLRSERDAAVEALEEIAGGARMADPSVVERVARTTLAKIKGGNDGDV